LGAHLWWHERRRNGASRPVLGSLERPQWPYIAIIRQFLEGEFCELRLNGVLYEVRYALATPSTAKIRCLGDVLNLTILLWYLPTEQAEAQNRVVQKVGT
jgi:hypothetical protein